MPHLWVKKISSREKALHALYYHTKFGAHSFIRSKVMEGVPNFKFRSRDPDHAYFRVYLLYIGYHMS